MEYNEDAISDFRNVYDNSIQNLITAYNQTIQDLRDRLREAIEANKILSKAFTLMSTAYESVDAASYVAVAHLEPGAVFDNWGAIRSFAVDQANKAQELLGIEVEDEDENEDDNG